MIEYIVSFLHFVDIKIDIKEDWSSQLQFLSLNDSSLTDNFWTSIEEVFQGRQIPLLDVNIGSNPDLSTKCLDSITKLTSGNTLKLIILHQGRECTS